MTLARVRRPTYEARPAAREASPMTYTPPWKYRTTWRGSIPSTVISAVGTPPSAAAVTGISAGSGCADSSSRSSRRCSLTSLPAGKADCRRTASRVSRCAVLTKDLPSVGLVWQRSRLARPCQSAAEISCREASHYQACRQAGEEASPDHGDSRGTAPACASRSMPVRCAANYQSLSPCCLHGLSKGLVLEGVHRRPVDRLDAVKLGQDRRERRSVEAVLHAYCREDDRHAKRLGGPGQQPDMQLDQVGARFRSYDLEHLILVVDSTKAQSSAVQTPRSFVIVALLCLSC